MEKLRSISVTFNSGKQEYEYLISEEGFLRLHLGDTIYILNESGYDYRNAVVTVVDTHFEPSDIATRQIVAFVVKSSDKWPRGAGWIDPEILNTNKDRQALFWIDERQGDINDRYTQVSNEFIVNFSNNDNEKGEDKMNIFGNIEFGKVNHRNTYAMTLKGLAYLRNDGTGEKQKVAYVQYDPKTESIEDVTPFVLDNMDSRDFVYKMPVATSAVKKGDIILDCSNPVFVKEVKDSTLTVVDPYSCEVKTILAAKNVFGFNFVTKIVNLMDSFNIANSANAENPFGNILPLMLLSKDSDMNDMLPLFLMSNGNFKSEDLMSNPLMMYFLMKDGKSNDMLPLLFMSNGGLFSAPAKEVSNEEV